MSKEPYLLSKEPYLLSKKKSFSKDEAVWPTSSRVRAEDAEGRRLVGSIIFYFSFAKEPYKRDDILQKRPVIWSILLAVA